MAKFQGYLRVNKYDVFDVLAPIGETYLGYVTAYNCEDALKIAKYKYGLGRESGLLQVALNERKDVNND